MVWVWGIVILLFEECYKGMGDEREREYSIDKNSRYLLNGYLGCF